MGPVKGTLGASSIWRLTPDVVRLVFRDEERAWYSESGTTIHPGRWLVYEMFVEECPRMAKGSTASITAQIRTSSRVHVKPRKHHAHRSAGVHQDQPRSAKKPRTIVPPPQSVRIMQRYISGESLRKIAQEEHRDRATISKIVRGPEVHQYIEELRARFFGAMEIAMETLLEELRDPDSRTRGGLAFEILKHGGVVPSERERELLAARRSMEPANHDDGVKRIMASLIEGIVARAAAFDMPVPELEEELKRAGGRINYETGKIEPLKTVKSQTC